MELDQLSQQMFDKFQAFEKAIAEEEAKIKKLRKLQMPFKKYLKEAGILKREVRNRSSNQGGQNG